MKVLILLSIVAASYASHQCVVNEHYESGGTACPLTCKNYDNHPQFCIDRCDIGCFCNEGYVRSSNGRCVKPEQCPEMKEPECGENQRYLECGTPCPLTCGNYNNPPKICPAMCVSGCHCEKGYVKTKDGRCVRSEDCPANESPECGENQRYLECGTPCPLTCRNYDNPPKICPAMCVSGCHCEKGYVKTKDGRCVRSEDCPTNERRGVKTCSEKPDKGMCLAYMPQWYYNAKDGKCYEFIYGGCQGNGNRYATEEECLEHCGTSRGPTACQEDKVVGPCKAGFQRFYYNKETGKCEEFTYGGCNGNSNNFHSQEECEDVCAASRAPTACEQEKVIGPCKAAFRRFFFNKETGKCEKFIYGGCRGNSNNFHSQEECEGVCAA